VSNKKHKQYYKAGIVKNHWMKKVREGQNLP